MENQPQNVNPQNVPAQPAPAQTPAQPTPTPAQSAVPAQKAPAKSVAQAKLPVDQAKANKRILLGCLTAFGCSIFIFIGVLFAFLAFGSSENPIFGFLGVPSSEVVNTLITFVNLIFLVLVFVSFLFVVIGIFKITTSKKEDKEGKRKGMMLSFGSLAIMVLLIFIWIFAYFFLASKRTISPKTAITTIPEKTINLTAPVTVKFDAAKAPINTRQFELLSYNWDFGDGASLVGNPQTHTFTKIGNFKVALSVTVKEKATGKQQSVEFTRDVTIQNVIANVVITADKTSGSAPLTINLDASKSNSPNGEITAYAWDLDENGEFNDGTNAIAQVTFDKVGKYKIGLRVTDSTGAFASSELDIEVTLPDTPTAVIRAEDASGTELEMNKAYVFTGASSTSPSGEIEKYAWEFGDGGKASTRTATHIYKEAGEYEVTLSVTDAAGKKGEASARFTVKAPAESPLASIETTPAAVNGVVSGQAPFDVAFDANKSQDPNNNIVEYAWDFDGDGKTDDTNATTSYKYRTAGTFNVSLTVTDATELSAKTQIVVQVAAAGLKADIKANPIAGVVPLTVSFDASGSSYQEGSIVAYEWDFGDGVPRTDTAKVSHQYTAIGTFTAKVTAITSDNKRASAEVPINVRPVPVKACFAPSVASGTAPLEVQFDPTCSTGTVVKYKWTFGDLGQSADRKPAYTFQNAGEYDVSLEVADSQNVVDTFTSKIKVAPK